MTTTTDGFLVCSCHRVSYSCVSDSFKYISIGENVVADSGAKDVKSYETME